MSAYIKTRASWQITAIALITLAASAVPLAAQNVTGTLTGTVADASGAVVPNATVHMKSELSGDTRRTVSNSEGYFSITAVQPGDYTVTAEAQGFKVFEQKGIHFDASDKRNLNIVLEVGATTETVEVTAQAADVTPVDSGEKSAVIGEKQLQNIAIVGSNAAEFIKILPGMAITGGTQNGAGFSGEVHGTGSGPIGSFAPNGQRTGALDITSDGAHVIDPGCNCGQAVDLNVDMTQELKVSTSNFGADSQKGPVVISGVGKQGGNAFHGQAYLYARDASMNANDALNKLLGAAAPQTRYIYPGGNIGGPVLLPHTHFNRNRDKLFFFVAYEYFNQTVDNGTYQAFTPTDAMRQGNFSQASLDALQPKGGNIGSGISNAPNFPGGIVPQSLISPIGQKLMNLYPEPNANSAGIGAGYNYVGVSTKPQNAYQFRPRVDWAINENTKLFFSYNKQSDTAYFTDTLWWRPAPTVPYPTRLLAGNKSDSISVNLTKVFSPTMTNEFIFTWTLLDLENSFEDPSKVDPAALGTSFKTIFGATTNEIPAMTGWGSGFANMIQPSGFQLTGSLYAKKTLPTIADNLSKVWGTHTAKFGFYWEKTSNNQPSNNQANGELIFANWGGNTTGNSYADLLTGNMAQYTETNKDVLIIMHYQPIEFYGQDSWKITKHLTIDYGVRMSHFGPWVDDRGNGLAIFDPSKYNPNAASTDLTGVLWHSKDSSVPLSGAPSRALFFAPRAGFAWDVFGTGKTVLRGGYGLYHFHDEQNVQAGALNPSQGVYGYTASNVGFSDIGNISASFVRPGGINVLDPKDDQQPRTQSYSFTVSQRVPWQSLFEVAYVGNKSDYLSNWNNNFGQINDLGYGTVFKIPGFFTTNGTAPPSSATDALRPYNLYQTIKVTNHQMYSNYNSMQTSWNKQSGRITFLANYTFSKALGIRGESGSATGDPTNLANNYGILPNDRTHIFNIAYVIELPGPKNGNGFVKETLNGWRLSGISQFQSGVDLQAAVSSNFNISGSIPAGTKLPEGTVLTSTTGASSVLINGTPDINMQPVLTCNPTANLAPNQFINGNCFAMPTPGHNGSFVMPYIKGPAFFNQDLTLFKDFRITERQKLQFRFQANNFLNHPLTSFINGDNNLNLSFDANGKLSNPSFGYAQWKTGHRIIQLALKYTF
ncbi:MAG TPA: carboxypeptidase-like regulatory domain-containing protein [Bryobacteraceae bacterium]|nr:carboxypeptidase-like regulatory domain-containing protein [Bryobacteraceae bacterium]